MKRLRLSREGGSVMVLVAAAMFPFMFLSAFAIDTSHWFDYSRNLQNRADAAALAGGMAFGNICLQGGTPGDVVTGAQGAIGKWAQLYSGAGTGEPSGSTATQLPYTNGAVSTATGWTNLNTWGYLNNTLPASPVLSPLNLKLGNLNNYWLVLNGKDYAEKGGASFSMTASGSGATFCSSDPKEDLTDPNRATAGPAGPMLDVKVTQKRLPLFFQGLPGLGFIKPNLHAHARVQLQGEASAISVPFAVADAGYTPCVSVDFINTTTNAVIATAVLNKTPPVNATDPVTWDNATVQLDSNGNPIAGTGPASVQIPTSANVYVQPFLNDCNGSGQRYNDSTHTGLLYINSYPQSSPAVGTNDPPALSPGGVFLTPGCAPNQYFSVGVCTDAVNAHVKFDPGITQNKTFVNAVDWQFQPTVDPVTGNPGCGCLLALKTVSLKQDTSDPTLWVANGASNMLNVSDSSGIHEIEITWEQKDGAVTGKGTCVASGTNPCTGSLGFQAQAFGACNGCDSPDDSGPVIGAQLSQGLNANTNALPQGTTQNLVVTLQLAGLSASGGTTILRVGTSTNHQTGLVDCGQGGGTGIDQWVVYYGCGPQNPHFTPPLNPLYMNTRNGVCPTSGLPASQQTWPNGNQQDCVQQAPGTRRVGIVCPLVDRIVGNPVTDNCNGNSGNTCATAPNNWPGNISGGDPRAITMIVTSPADLAATAGSPQGWFPIRRFATFYVTGWDQNIKPQCTGTQGNEPFPGKGKQSQNGAVWGHWMNYVDNLGIGDNQNCPVNSVQPINCVPVLTR
jgi:hypothetical protein